MCDHSRVPPLRVSPVTYDALRSINSRMRTGRTTGVHRAPLLQVGVRREDPRGDRRELGLRHFPSSVPEPYPPHALRLPRRRGVPLPRTERDGGLWIDPATDPTVRPPHPSPSVSCKGQDRLTRPDYLQGPRVPLGSFPRSHRSVDGAPDPILGGETEGSLGRKRGTKGTRRDADR